jgi:hypothetical protein
VVIPTSGLLEPGGGWVRDRNRPLVDTVSVVPS